MFARVTYALIGLAFCCFTAPTVHAARILVFFPTPSKSHTLIHASVADTLARAGHNVTVLGVSHNVFPKANYKYIQIASDDRTSTHQSTLKSMVNNKSGPVFLNAFKLLKSFVNAGNLTLNHPKMRKFLSEHREGDFDLVLVGYATSDYALGLGAHFRCPMVLSFVVQPIHDVLRLVGSPVGNFHISTVLMNSRYGPETFWGRVELYLINTFKEWLLAPEIDRVALEVYK